MPHFDLKCPTSTNSALLGIKVPHFHKESATPGPNPSGRKGGGEICPPSEAKKREKRRKIREKSKKSALRAEFTLNLPLYCLNLDKIELFQGSRPPNLAYLVKNRIFLRASETLFSNFSGGFAPRPPPGGYRPLDPHFLS